MTTDNIINDAIDTLLRVRPGFWSRTSCGVTRSLTPIPALLDRNAYSFETSRTRILLVGGLSGEKADVDMALHALELFAGGGDALSLRVALSAVPCANPDGLRLNVAPGNGAGGDPSGVYPPEGKFYYDPENPEKRYLWRWITFQAPELVLELRSGNSVRWEHNQAAGNLAPGLGGRTITGEQGLLAALGTGHPDGLGTIPGIRLTASDEQMPRELSRLFSMLRDVDVLVKSNARLALDARRARPGLVIAKSLAAAYGHTFEPVVYTQGVPISGRLRLHGLDPKGENPAPDVARLLESFTAEGVPEGIAPSALASVVWADELSEATGDTRYNGLIIQAADRFESTGQGSAPKPCDPDFRTEDMFMAGSVLGRAFKLTGEKRYADILANFIVDGKIQQDHGLFWHCRSAAYYWGRGNGFAAMGLTESLTYLPEDQPQRAAITAMYRRLMESLRRLQHPSGLLANVLDFPGSYLEFTATCMMGYSIARGLRLGILTDDFREPLDLAWGAVAERIDDVGGVVDGCASTGVQNNVREYLDRPAIFGFDDRSGGMALWFNLEMERLARGI
ncbi:MAG: glycoside hydrolase family 88 protein [Chloroflexi bacterium]|nr:glycoside hydrolase family 88 protein [Chloroflexota bacterium]MDA1271073.1 glycoside hydrolase family 88 protein [Chloroflexota bacterium]